MQLLPMSIQRTVGKPFYFTPGITLARLCTVKGVRERGPTVGLAPWSTHFVIFRPGIVMVETEQTYIFLRTTAIHLAGVLR